MIFRQSAIRWGKGPRELCLWCESLLEQLQQRTFEQIASLPECSTEEIEILGRRALRTVYRSENEDKATLIAVQGILQSRWIPFFSDWYADGFCIYPDGKRRNLTREELSSYD